MIVRHYPGLAASPPVRYILKVRGEVLSSSLPRGAVAIVKGLAAARKSPSDCMATRRTPLAPDRLILFCITGAMPLAGIWFVWSIATGRTRVSRTRATAAQIPPPVVDA